MMCVIYIYCIIYYINTKCRRLEYKTYFFRVDFYQNVSVCKFIKQTFCCNLYNNGVFLRRKRKKIL